MINQLETLGMYGNQGESMGIKENQWEAMGIYGISMGLYDKLLEICEKRFK